MLFNSFAFWLFYAVVFLLYYRLKHRGQNVLLLLASYYFYGCWDWRFLSLIAISTLVDYTLALRIHDCQVAWKRKTLLAISLCTNLGILAFFKYFNFFAGELVTLGNTVGVPLLLPTLNIILPVGISFYTFQTMSYSIDVYRGHCQPTRSLLDFSVYVSFFPQLVAGPIERASHFLPQVTQPRQCDRNAFGEGLYLVVLGLFKKIVVADNMAVLVNAIFQTPTSELTGMEVLVGVYAFAFQIYGDFSGYSAIARGISRWLGFDLMVNFRRPYFAVDPSDFWRRWHISLSQWLRDYLYIPLGGNRGGSLMTYRNLMLTMLLGGLWHGANWTFIAWGAVHGLMLCGYRYVAGDRAKSVTPTQWTPLGVFTRAAKIVLMFHFVCLTWLLFRAESIGQAAGMLSVLATNMAWSPLASMTFGMLLFCAGPLMLFECWEEWQSRVDDVPAVHWSWRGVACTYALMMCLCFPPPAAATFIYFQF